MRSQTLSSLSLLSIALFLLPSTSALRIIVTPTTHTGAATTVYWIREPSDPQPLFDLRFVVQPEGAEGEADVGLAAANIPISVGSGDGEIRMGKEEVRFPKSGHYVLKAVAGPTFQVIGTSNEVVVSPPETITLSTTPTSTSTSTSTGKSTETNETGFGGSQSNNAKSKTPLIVGATLGSILFLALVAFLLWFLLRRRRLAKERDRLSFRPEDMVSRRRSRPKWVSRLSLRVQARDEHGPASAPAWGGSSFPATTTTNTVTENPFATPAGTPPGAQDREVSFAQPPPTPSAKNVLASVPPSRREMIAREMRSSSTSVSMYSQDSNTDVDVEAQTSESKSDAKSKRRSGTWTLVEQALENVKRRASMVSRSSSVVESRVGTPLPVSASPYITSFTPSAIPAPQPQSTSTIGTGTTSTPAPSTAAPAPRNMAERAGKRISILPPLPPSALPSTAQDTQSNVRGLPPVPLGPAFDAVSVLSASGSEGDDGSKGQEKEGKMSEKARGKQRSDSVVKKAKLETIPASPVSTVSGSVGHGSVPPVPESTSSTPSPPPPPPPAAVTEEKSIPEEHPKETKEPQEEPVKEKRPLPTPTPVIHAPVPSVPVVPPPPAPRSRPLPSPLVLKSATFAASNIGSSSTAGVARTATLAHPPNSASLRALPPLPPTPKTGANPRSATVPTSAAPYTPSFPIPTVPSYPSLPPTPATGVPAVLTPALKEDGQPVSATVERTPSYTRDTVPPVLRTYTKRQRHIEHRIGQVKVQMRLLKRKIASSQVDSEVGSRVVADLSKQLAWLELHLYGDWALEVEGAQKPEGWGRYMRP